MGFQLGRNNLLYKFVSIIGHICLPLFYSLKIEGQENIPPQGPAIILPKHQFWTDIPLVGLAFPQPLNYLAKKELFLLPLIRHFLIAMGGIPLDRLNPVKSINSFRHLEKLIKAKEFIVLFPEGTYYPYRMGPGKHRLIKRLINLQKNIPFIPMGLKYGPPWWRPRVEIKIGHPFYAHQETESAEFTKTLINEIGRLSGLRELDFFMGKREEEESGEPGSAVANQG